LRPGLDLEASFITLALAFALKLQTLALVLRAALTIFGITFKRKKNNKINNSYNNELIIIYV